MEARRGKGAATAAAGSGGSSGSLGVQQGAPEVRDLLVNELCDDIVGPRGGPEEVLSKSESPLRGYLSGILFPQRSPPDEEADEGRADVQAGGGGDGDGDASDALGAAAGPLSSAANPSSFGLACTVRDGAAAVQAVVEYGTYAEEAAPDSGTVRFRRVPHSETVTIPVAGDGMGSLPLQGALGLDAEIRYVAKRARSGGGTTLRVFMVNKKVHRGDDLPDVSACVFQPRIALSAPPGPARAEARIFVGGRGGPAGQDSDDLLDPDLALFEMLFRDKDHIATGHCCAAEWDENEAAEHGAVSRLRTTFVPRYDVPHVGPRRSGAACLDMKTLYKAGMADYTSLLSPLADMYDGWIASELESRAGSLPPMYKGAADRQVSECRSALGRIRRGIEIISTDRAAAAAFSFANRAMHLQMSHARWIRDRSAGADVPAYEPGPYMCRWHLFQLAFFLLNIESITDPESPDRSTADLLWFPTGGGKTEAYLGLIAFTLAHRRARAHGGAPHLRYGTAVVMRYTLRLLTLQQFHRAAALVCACESIRRLKKDEWGDEPFLVGLWVGAGATPNRLDDAEESLRDARAGRPPREGNPVQIISCPWCGHEIAARDYSVSGTPRQCRIHCPRPQCEFSRGAGHGEDGLPVLVVDEDIYRRCPSMVIGTVDKFAQVTWKWEAGALFGRVDKYCEKHGFVVSGLDKRCGKHAGTKSFLLGDYGPTFLDPPELIIQDELHLISGPLGTLTGIYETVVDHLCTDRRKARPKIVASTATAKKASAQMLGIFDRPESRVFPPQGFDFGESFFATRADPSESPGRAYVGVCVTSRSGPTVLGRLSAAVLRKVRSLEERAAEGAPGGGGGDNDDNDDNDGGGRALSELDSYHTLVAYFNTIRDLGGANKMYDDTVPRLIQRIYANFESDADSADADAGGIARPGAADAAARPARKDNALLEKKELTSRIDSSEIPDILRSLEARIDGTATGSGSGTAGPPRPVDVLLCTNMLSVGVDIPRLGVMIVNGQPKNHSEYIQATGRIGRASPGLVIANLNYFRPRDLSHYEDFTHYHSALHKLVEPNTITPFSPRSRDRALFGVLAAMMRHSDIRLADERGAAGFRTEQPSYAAGHFAGVRDAIVGRAGRVDHGEEEGTARDVDRLARKWHRAAAKEDPYTLPLRYSRPPHPLAGRQDNAEYLMRRTGEDGSAGLVEAPNSLRDAEQQVPIWYLDDMREGGHAGGGGHGRGGRDGGGGA